MNYILSVDNTILDFIQNNICNPLLDKLMVFITTLGNAGMLWIGIGIVLLFIKNYRKYGIMIFLALFFSNIIGNNILKHLAERARPCHVNTAVDLLINMPKSFSFPSGHTFTSFAAATVIFFMNKKIGSIALIVAALIGFSRMYLYVHYPSDVLVGGLLGIIVGAIVVKLWEKFKDKKLA